MPVAIPKDMRVRMRWNEDMGKDWTTLLLIMPPQLGLLSGFAAGLISLANYVAARQPEVCVEILDLSARSLDDVDRTLLSRFRNSAHLYGNI